MEDDQPKLTKQQIYNRIRESSKDEYILSEMKRLGFWPDNAEKPSVAEQLIERRAELSTELRELGRKKALYDDPERALKQLHKKRKNEALEKREQTKQQRNQQRYDRALDWHTKQQSEISWLGEGISLGLNEHESDSQKLAAQKLPLIETPLQLAQAMGISVGELRFLSYKKRVSEYSHYQHFSIPKKSGGVRDIAAPMPRLKRAQYWILGNILNAPEINDCAHGFLPGRSIVTNATPHVGRDVVVNMDLENFFPSISFGRVKGVFRHFGYSEALATVLASLCTDAEQQLIDLDGQLFFVDQSKPRLPQGAPTSPALSNLICRRLDPRVKGAAASLGFNYTRYADDLSFSGDSKSGGDVQKLLWRVRQIIESEGFTVNRKKTRIMRKHRHQEVTGIVVNDKLGVDRKTLRRFRSLLHQIKLNGPEGKQWGGGELYSSILGYANFVAMVNPLKGRELQTKVYELAESLSQGGAMSGSTAGSMSGAGKSRPVGESFRALATQGKPPSENWWQPAGKSAPVLEKTKAQIDEERRKAKAASKATDSKGTQASSRQGGAGADTNSAWIGGDEAPVVGFLPKLVLFLFMALIMFLYLVW